MRARKCLLAIIAALSGIGVTAALGVRAQVVQDPTGSVCIDTGSQGCTASDVAVSKGGNATSGGAAVSLGGGTATAEGGSLPAGRVAISTGGMAYACGSPVNVAVAPSSTALSCPGSQVSDPSGQGLVGVGLSSASGRYVAVGGGGASSQSGAAIALNGQASGGPVAVGVFQNSSASDVAISGTGDATACGGPVTFSESPSDPHNPNPGCKGSLPLPIGSVSGPGFYLS